MNFFSNNNFSTYKC